MKEIIVSGMRPTGRLHIGHYHGVLKNWVRLQDQGECYFFVADWHALTTHYESVEGISTAVWDMLVEWLAVGIDPDKAVLFIQSHVPQHAELALLLGMLTPLSWLERVPTFKDQQEKLRERDLATFGFLGYPLLMTADILLYEAQQVPVGADQVAHLEISRELARRFNSFYGRDAETRQQIERGLQAMGKRAAKTFAQLQQRFQQNGDLLAVTEAAEFLRQQAGLSPLMQAQLLAHLEGKGREILREPQALLTAASKLPGLDGQKMSKSYGNTIPLQEDPEHIRKKIRTMPTDPARVMRTDPGTPEKCPVWGFHQVYSSEETRNWVRQGCTSAGIGCLDCKQPVIEAVLVELAPIRERAEYWAARPEQLREIAHAGAQRARNRAGQTMEKVRSAMGLAHELGIG
ncbi:tryptophan--tRNA ligase [Acidithiobacillus thiooxidans]|jgi:tryptophanyl-tRNA synthetase|uniref:Tryptophan--tRNA ligase n=2 Tax=Acidithiobacillus thiooxidans TaxID=930 RepID=A0A1C2JNH0_ACITH|nr:MULTISPECIES: tryptophan--tRNA ligase [Acidithiobacillus]MBE7565573.1 tryptophan--tRNA ligase [Acidithiobacillus sp. HP-11]MBU2740322.1 tryptophan--tRNA ligase [Acidithiobacillus albertensis]MBU2751937.1 tryptophan--tRNA ligase [Acidithiobacillus thiooxidans]MBU2794055.1 tryptophan--tRNA ligase [Acidithiobacillus thiooxidans]MBU2810526.1 tryptophan--tRNA ligase [Acidithiobacillus thiooxidans]